MDRSKIRELCLELGADNAGFVEVDRASLDTQHATAEGLKLRVSRAADLR